MMLIPLAFLLIAAPVFQGQPPPKPCAAAEFHQFDFWIGEWEVRGPKGAVAGSSRIESIEGGCGIQENWSAAGGVTGRSINAYDRIGGKWHQAWIGAGGQFLHLVGSLQGKEMVLEGESMNQQRQATIERVTWTPLPDGRVRQFWQQSIDGGKTWTVAFDGFYSKR